VLIRERIAYLLQMRKWTEKELGAKLANNQAQLKVVEQWQVSRWKLDKEKPSRIRLEQIEQLCYETILLAFNSPKGFRYICNLGEGYGNHYKDREDEALARLRTTLTRECPFAPTGRLQIVVFTTNVPEGVRAQCFCSDEDDPRCFIVLVPNDDEWRTNVRDEIFAHVLPMSAPGFKVRDN
jgi:DNA-binding Xre family transcriptional regulator